MARLDKDGARDDNFERVAPASATTPYPRDLMCTGKADLLPALGVGSEAKNQM